MKKLLYIISLITLTSCSDDYVKLQNDDAKEISNISNKIASSEDYYNFLNPQTDDFIMIEDLRSFNGDPIENNIYSQSRNSLPISLTVDGSPLTGSLNNSTDLSFWNGKFDAKGFFNGNYVSSLLRNNVLELTSTQDIENSTYIPKQMDVKISNLDEEGRVMVGTTISWNPDAENPNGILAGIEYSPYNQCNPNIAALNLDVNRRFSTIDDNGTYRITEGDLQHFPKDATLKFYIGRINKIVKVDEITKRSLSVNIYTAVTTDLATSTKE